MSEEQTTEPVEEVSRDDELGALYDQITAEPEETPAETPKEDQPRGPDGKFIAKEQDAPQETSAPFAEESAEPSAVAEAEPGQPGLEPPASWSAAAKAIWPSIDPVAQQEFLRREKDWQKADGERAQRLKGYEPIDAALEPVRDQLQLSGVDPANYVRQLIAADNLLKSDPHRAIQWIAQQYGIDLSQAASPAEEDMSDPALAPLMAEIHQLKSQVSQQTVAQQNAEAQRISGVIERFMANPENKYAQRIEEKIVAEIPAVRSISPGSSPEEVLKMAYDRAVRLDDTIQAELLAEKTAEAEARRKEEQEKRAADARRISDTNLASRGTSGGQTPPQYANREDELGAIYDQVQGAA